MVEKLIFQARVDAYEAGVRSIIDELAVRVRGEIESIVGGDGDYFYLQD